MMTPNDLTRFRTSVLLVQLTFQLTLGHEVQFVLHSLHQYENKTLLVSSLFLYQQWYQNFLLGLSSSWQVQIQINIIQLKS